MTSDSKQTGSSMEFEEITTSKNQNSDFNMDVDCDSNKRETDEFVPFSVPGFLRKVFMEELGNDSGHDHKLVVTAIHAVLLESGFVGFDPNTNVVVNNRLCCPAVWPSPVFSLSLYYTLPDIGTPDTVVVKFQSLGKFISVYGLLSGAGGKVGKRMVRLNEDKFVPFLNAVWANCGVQENTSCQAGISSPQKEVFKFWRAVKDNLALPLLIDICDKAGLGLPPCFMWLPTDLKLKIVESLSGVELAKLGSTCSEIRYLASSDELWKVKVEEEFGKEVKKGEGSWKRAFARQWELRQNSRRNSRIFAARAEQPSFWLGFGSQPFFPPRFPYSIGGDYDMWPNIGGNFGGNAHFSLAGAGPGAHVNRLNFSPPCDLE